MYIINSSDFPRDRIEWFGREVRNLLTGPFSSLFPHRFIEVFANCRHWHTHAPRLCRRRQFKNHSTEPTKYNSNYSRTKSLPFALSDWSTVRLKSYVSSQSARRMHWFGDKLKRNKTWIGPSIVHLCSSCCFCCCRGHSMIYVLIVKYFSIANYVRPAWISTGR